MWSGREVSGSCKYAYIGEDNRVGRVCEPAHAVECIAGIALMPVIQFVANLREMKNLTKMPIF